MKLIFFLFTLILTLQIDARVNILTFAYNLPELIPIQYKTCKRFIKEDHELIVFNDARDPKHEKDIQEVCDKYGIRCIRFQPEWHDTDPFNVQIKEWANNPELYSHIGPLYVQHPSLRHCHVIEYALKNYGYNHDDLVVLLDGDCFPIRPTSLKKLIGNNDIVGIRKEQGGYEYLWVVFSLFDPRKIPYKNDLRFTIDVINNEIHDTGAHTYHYLKDHPDVLYQKFLGGSSVGFYHWTDDEMIAWGFNANEISLMRELDALKGFSWPITVEFQVENRFCHLGNSSFGLQGQQEKLECIHRFAKNILKSDKLKKKRN